MSPRKLVPGTVRFRPKGETRYTYTSPGNYRYSTALMLAQEYYDGRKWLPYIPGLNDLTTIEEQSRGNQVRHRKAQDNKKR